LRLSVVYEFYCKKCNAIDEVERKLEQAKEPYICPECKSDTVRRYTAPMVVTKGEQIRYFHPAFGKVMTDNEAKAEAKAQGMIEVGNEDMVKHTNAPKRVDYDEPDYFL